MNALRIISYVSRRTYSRRSKNVGIKSKLLISKKSGLNVDIDEINHDDLDEFESDYMNAHKFYDIHEWEKSASKEQLKNKIVATKYFKKDKDPNFLTTVEKNDIRKLHASNPEEWTIERLSESFPALPGTIKKILKSNWPLSSVEQVLRNDATVINNWKQFQAGKLPISPCLREHLMKFKNRTIVLPNRDLLAKSLIPQKPELPKPRSKLYSQIIQNYLDKSESNQCNSLPLQNNEKMIIETNISDNIIKDKDISKNLSDKENTMKKEVLDKNKKLVVMENQNPLKRNVRNTALTLNEFAKKELPKIYEECPVEGITLLKLYKKYLQSQDSLSSNMKEDIAQSKHTETTVKEIISNSLNENDNIVQSKHIETTVKETISDSLNENDNLQLVSREKVDVNVDTYIKVRHSKIAKHETYPLPIKIPRNIYKKGKTYRICDCYYDDDGQFLYRVPGLRN